MTLAAYHASSFDNARRNMLLVQLMFIQTLSLDQRLLKGIRLVRMLFDCPP
jgi:hypothetical protein